MRLVHFRYQPLSACLQDYYHQVLILLSGFDPCVSLEVPFLVRVIYKHCAREENELDLGIGQVSVLSVRI